MKRFVVNSSTKKAIKASSRPVTQRYVVDYCNALLEAGCDEHEIFLYFFDKLPSDQLLSILRDYAWVCECEDEVDEIMSRR